MVEPVKYWKDDDERRVAAALGQARDAWFVRVKSLPDGHDLVFRVIQNVTDIHRRSKMKGGPAGNRSCWPDYVHTWDEREEMAKQQRIAEAAGEDPDLILGFVVAPGPQEIAMMDSVNLVFESCLIGDKQPRDWKLLQRFAAGLTAKQIAKELHISHSRATDRKTVQCLAIWRRVDRLLPAVAPASIVLCDEAA